MLDADDVKNDSARREDWDEWQRAATEYWLLLHPELSWFRRGNPGRTPSIEEFRERGEALWAARDSVPSGWRLAPPSLEKAEHLARIGWFHELLAAVYGPVDHAIERIRQGDDSGVETLVRFLEADVYCHRSGYVKADAIRFVTRASLSEAVMKRLRGVVLEVVDSHDRREFRSYIRLARPVDSDGLRQELRDRLDSDNPRTVRHAQWMLDGLGVAAT